MTEITHTQYENIPGIIRKMSQGERFFFMNPSCTVMMMARITGTLDKARFRQALDNVCRIHPLLRAKIVFDNRHDAWFSSDGVPPVPIRIIPRISERQWLDELKSEARVPFAIDKGPLIRCVLLQSSEISDLLIFCNHSICDGMALVGFVREILSQYGNPAQEIRVINPPDVMEILKPRFSLKDFISGFFVSFANMKWRKNPYRFGPEEYDVLYRAYWEGRRPGLVLLEFNREKSAHLQATCREHGVTVGSAVSTACYGAYQEIVGELPKSQQVLMVPYDMRKRITPPSGDVFCGFAGVFQLPFAYSPEKSLWDNAAVLHRAIHSRLENPTVLGNKIPVFEPSLIDAINPFGLYVDKVPGAYTRTKTLQRFFNDTGTVARTFTRNFEKNAIGFISSNLGRIDMPQSHEGPRLDRLIFVPAASELNPLMLGGIGINGRIVISLPFVDPPAKTGISPEPDMIRIRNRALELLGFPEMIHPYAIE